MKRREAGCGGGGDKQGWMGSKVLERSLVGSQQSRGQEGLPNSDLDYTSERR